VLGAKEVATTAAGQKLQVDELHKTAKKAAGALLAVAIIQTVIPVGLFVLMRNVRPGAGALNLFNNVTMGIMLAIAAVFWGLWAWARVNPLPAAIVGLVLYVTLTVADYVMLFAMMKDAPPGNSPNIGIPWMKIIIISILVQGISAGSKHRKLMRQQAGTY
jgi:hypothetical protein